MVRHRWGSEVINPNNHDIPSLKFSYIMPCIKKKNIKILEIGSGNGKILRTIGKINTTAKLYGCDINKPTIKPDFNFTLIKGKNLPYKDDTFDVVLIIDVLEHIKDYRYCIKEIKRILKKGGIFTGFIPNEGNFLSPYWLAAKIFGKDVHLKTRDHVNSFKTKESMKILKKGFIVKRFNFSYHFFGQIMDCTLFLLLLNKKIEKLFWEKNQYYNTKEDSKSSVTARLFNFFLTIANKIAYHESRLFKDTRFCSSGLHFVCINR